MRKFIEWAKRPVNFNFVSIIAVAAAFMLIAVTGYVKFMPEDSQLSELRTEINNARGQEEIDDVGGYGLILNLFAYGLVKMADILNWGLYICIPIIISAGAFFWAIVLRLVYSNKSRIRILIYRIIAALFYYFMFFAAIIYVLSCIYAFMFLPAIILTLFVIPAVIINVRNTYSRRIFDEY